VAEAVAADTAPLLGQVDLIDGAPIDVDGGGDALASAVGATPKRPVLVEPVVSATKLRRELDDWAAAEPMYRHRGIVLRHVDELVVEATFLRRGQVFPAPYVAVCIEFDYTNYDLEPPSLTIIDPFTGAPGLPYLPVLHVDREAQAVQPLVPGPHPDTGLPFLCIPGTWEFHSHMEHTNEPWLGELRRNRAGSLAVLTSRIAGAFHDVGFVIRFEAAVVPGPA
jgi:hypothetical protein